MAPVIDMHEHRERRMAEEHARALVLFECAALLARRKNPRLLALIGDTFGLDEIERRVQETARPQRRSQPEPVRLREVGNDD